MLVRVVLARARARARAGAVRFVPVAVLVLVLHAPVLVFADPPQNMFFKDSKTRAWCTGITPLEGVRNQAQGCAGVPTPGARLLAPSAGAAPVNAARTGRETSVRPNPVVRMTMDTAVKTASRASDKTASPGGLDGGHDQDADSRAPAHSVDEPDAVRAEGGSRAPRMRVGPLAAVSVRVDVCDPAVLVGVDVK